MHIISPKVRFGQGGTKYCNPKVDKIMQQVLSNGIAAKVCPRILLVWDNFRHDGLAKIHLNYVAGIIMHVASTQTYYTV